MEKKNYVIPTTEHLEVSFANFLMVSPPAFPTPGRKGDMIP